MSNYPRLYISSRTFHQNKNYKIISPPYIYIYIYIRMSTGRMCFCVRGAILFRDSLESVTKRLLRSYQWITYFKMTVIRKNRRMQMGVIYLYLHCTTLSVRSKLFSQEIHLRPLPVSPREKPEVPWEGNTLIQTTVFGRIKIDDTYVDQGQSFGWTIARRSGIENQV